MSAIARKEMRVPTSGTVCPCLLDLFWLNKFFSSKDVRYDIALPTVGLDLTKMPVYFQFDQVLTLMYLKRSDKSAQTILKLIFT